MISERWVQGERQNLKGRGRGRVNERVSACGLPASGAVDELQPSSREILADAVAKLAGVGWVYPGKSGYACA
jgi:hypothetical protein